MHPGISKGGSGFPLFCQIIYWSVDRTILQFSLTVESDQILEGKLWILVGLLAREPIYSCIQTCNIKMPTNLALCESTSIPLFGSIFVLTNLLAPLTHSGYAVLQMLP
jgi:hypothetical protein